MCDFHKFITEKLFFLDVAEAKQQATGPAL